jgi:DNA-binding MarR family transcriptional regulator
LDPEPRPDAAGHRSPRLDDAVAFRIHQTNRLLRTHLSRFLQRVSPGLTPEQWFLLVRLGERHGAVRQVDLAESVLGDPPNVSRLVDGLEARGMVERRPDPRDRRTRLLHLTPAGAKVVDDVYERVIDERHAVFAGFDTAELAALTRALRRIDANLRRMLGGTGLDAGPPDRES